MDFDFFAVKTCIIIGNKRYVPCVCYNATRELELTIKKLSKEGKTYTSNKYMIFENGVWVNKPKEKKNSAKKAEKEAEKAEKKAMKEAEKEEKKAEKEAEKEEKKENKEAEKEEKKNKNK